MAKKSKKSNADAILKALESLTPKEEEILSEGARDARKYWIKKGRYPAESA